MCKITHLPINYCYRNLKKWSWGHSIITLSQNALPGFVMNSKLSFSRLFQKMVGEKYIIFPDRGSKNYIIFPENQWNKRGVRNNVSITVIKVSNKVQNRMMKGWCFIRTEEIPNMIHLNTGVAGDLLSLVP